MVKQEKLIPVCKVTYTHLKPVIVDEIGELLVTGTYVITLTCTCDYTGYHYTGYHCTEFCM